MQGDEEIYRELQSGSASALEALVHRYHGPIFGYIYRQVHDEGVAQDLTQETFLRVCTRIGQYRYPEPFRPWIYRIALNICRDYWRSPQYRERRQAADMAAEAAAGASSVANIYDRQETRAEVRQAVLGLREIYRDVLILRFYQDLKLDEIARVLRLPLGTVKWRLWRALELMKEQLMAGGVVDDWARSSDN